MPWFRRKESTHARLAREGGLELGPGRAPHDLRPMWGEVGIHGVHRLREYDAVEVVETDDVHGERADFVALSDGTLVVEEGGGGALDLLAEAVERTLAPPYRAEATRRPDGLWAVAARQIEVLELGDRVGGDAIEISVHGDQRTVTVDGMPTIARFDELESLAASRYESYAIQASRLDENVWEVGISPL
jgi:hypothetical protein